MRKPNKFLHGIVANAPNRENDVGCMIMTDAKDRLMAWRPGMDGFSHDETIFAVGLQCRKKPFPVSDILLWLGPPHKSCGNAAAGHLAYLYSDPDDDVFAMFWIEGGRAVRFGGVSRFVNNSRRTNPETGKEEHFNLLDEMELFNERDFT